MYSTYTILRIKSLILFHFCTDGEKALSFVLACLLLVGMLVFISYTVSWNKRLVTLPYPILPFPCHAMPYHTTPHHTTPCPISNTLPSLFKAPGLSILPFNMIKGRRRLEIEENDVEARLSQCREQQRAIKLKASPESLSAKDLRRLENLEDQER